MAVTSALSWALSALFLCHTGVSMHGHGPGVVGPTVHPTLVEDSWARGWSCRPEQVWGGLLGLSPPLLMVTRDLAEGKRCFAWGHAFRGTRPGAEVGVWPQVACVGGGLPLAVRPL